MRDPFAWKNFLWVKEHVVHRFRCPVNGFVYAFLDICVASPPSFSLANDASG
jgi:hypothetical protein